MPQGIANDLGTNWWQIVDNGGNELARFDHDLFKTIRNRASVTYVDADGDGIAENVQPAVAVARYMARAAQANRLNDEKEALIFEKVMNELREALTETNTGRQSRLRRLRTTLDTFE